MGKPVGMQIRMPAKPVERRFSWGCITSFGEGLQLIDYVGRFLKLAPFHTDPIFSDPVFPREALGCPYWDHPPDCGRGHGQC